MWKRGRPDEPASARDFPPELLEEARTRPGGWVYVIDPAFAPDGADGAVPPEGIVGAWKVGEDGVPTGEFEKNSRYHGDRDQTAP